MTVEQLAEEVRKHGGSLSRSAITKIENGDRGMSLDEALLLAAVLKIPPAQLFFPMETGEKVAVTARNVIHPHLAYEWLTGREPLATTERFASGIREWQEAAWPLALYDDLRAEQNATHAAASAVRTAEYVGNDAAIRKARERFARQLRNLAQVLKEMSNRGMTPPRMPKEWQEQIDRFDLMKGN